MSGAPRRVYLALGRAGLEDLARQREVRAPAYAVTDAVLDTVPGAPTGADIEELEYDALLRAAEDPAARAGAGDRVVVAAADLAAPEVSEPEDRQDGYAVALAGPVRLGAVVSFHVSEAAADAETELLWYDVTELDLLVTELAGH